MPRLSRQLLATAWKENVLLPPLLRSCRDLRSARLELKWLREHAQKVARRYGLPSFQPLLSRICHQRSRGKPLQYILGTEFFGELELKCRPGVLIPRPDTAAYVTHLVNLLKSSSAKLPRRLRVLDLCTGSGCIPLLFAHLWSQFPKQKTYLGLAGVDISSNAIALSRYNQAEQAKIFPKCKIKKIEFIRADILTDDARIVMENLRRSSWDRHNILISNPPYVSPRHFNHTTSRSVRNFEPKGALVPDVESVYPRYRRNDQLQDFSDDQIGDLFYRRLQTLARQARARVLLVEVGDLDQAKRVATFFKATKCWQGVEIWRDDPAATDEAEFMWEEVRIRGTGNGRSVVCWRKEGTLWLGRSKNENL